MIFNTKYIRSNSGVLLAITILLACQIFHNDAFFLDKWDRLKRKWGLPSVFNGLGSGLGGGGGGHAGFGFGDKARFGQGIRVCINFTANFPQGYQQNTCFYCESSRISQISLICAGQPTIPENINYTQANCIMNSCQPSQQSIRQYPIANSQVTAQTQQP